MRTLTVKTAKALIGKKIKWEVSIYKHNKGFFGNGLDGGIAIIKEVQPKNLVCEIIEGSDLNRAVFSDYWGADHEAFSYSDSDRIISYEAAELEPENPFSIKLMNKAINKFTAVHVNKYTAAIHWYGTNSFGKDVPLFGSDYYDIKDLPYLIKKHFNNLNIEDIEGKDCYVKNGVLYSELKDLAKNAY